MEEKREMKAWIVRHEDGMCSIYTEKPSLCKGIEDGEEFEYWDTESPSLFEVLMPETFHPEVTFDNSPLPIDFTPDDGIAILKRIEECIKERLAERVLSGTMIKWISCEMFMLGHTITMLELMKGGEK